MTALALAVAASGCGQVAGDCSGAAPDGAGNCSPDDHGPVAAQQAAFDHYGDHAEQVLCMNHGTFRHQAVEYHGYGCKAIRNSDLLNDEIYCVELRDGVPLSDRETATLLDAVPLEQQRCG